MTLYNWGLVPRQYRWAVLTDSGKMLAFVTQPTWDAEALCWDGDAAVLATDTYNFRDWLDLPTGRFALEQCPEDYARGEGHDG